MPLILTYGWPGSFIEMEKVIPLLADPGAHGGDPADAFHVVVPSLPGYGFSQAPDRLGLGASRIVELGLGLIHGPRYDTFGAQGGDVGASIATWLAYSFPRSVVGLHPNYVPGSYRPLLGDWLPPVTAEEQSGAAAWAAAEGAYAHMHATKPQTLAYGLNDSPVALAAWIVEKFRAWCDRGGEVERVFDLDTLLTDISLYWFSGTVDATVRVYKETVSLRFASASGSASSRRSEWRGSRASSPPHRDHGWRAAMTSCVGRRCRGAATLRRRESRSCSWKMGEPSSDR